jgi:hypothetical protein
MSESSDDPLIARVAGELRRPVPISPDFDARVMASVRRAPAALPLRAWAWLREPRTLAVSPLGGLAMAAGVAGLVLVGIWGAGRSAGSRERGAGGGARSAVGALAAGAPASVTFVFLAPEDVPLAPGRYQYAFVVDGRRFLADPSAPRATGDDFGTPTSVVTVGDAARAAGGSL